MTYSSNIQNPMLKQLLAVTAISTSLAAPTWAQAPSAASGSVRRVALGDWPEARGANRDGTSQETGLPSSWDLKGTNLLWRVPYGGRSAPIVMGNHVYVQNPSGRGPSLQERVVALDADTGKVAWEYKFNIFQSDVPPHRVGWASPAADPETGNVYALGVGATLVALSANGKPLWQRSIGEEFAAFTTHGGRTMSPIVDGDLVIVSAAVSNWGTQAARSHRIIALNKRTGDIVYVSNPGGRPYDTAYAAPYIATINGTRLLIVGLGDGGIHAIKVQTGEKVWSYVAAKRAINTGVVVSGSTVIISHGDENLTGNEMGMIAAIDGSQTGDIKAAKWAHFGEQFGFSSPLVDGPRLYQIENGSRLKAYDIETGKELWTQPLGTSQKAPPVMADGKIYVGSENGKFFVVRPHADRAEILSEVQLPLSTNSIGGSEGTEEQVFAGAAISRGRVFFVSSDAVYAIGPRQKKTLTGWAANETIAAGEGAPAYVLVSPTELVLEPGRTVKLTARSFDSRGRFLREEKATWSLDGLKGTIADGTLTSTDLARAVTRLAWFYRASPHVATTPDAYVAGFAHAIDANAEALAWPAYGLPAADVDALCSLQHAALARLAPLLAARAGRVVEAHGDLRPEHVCVDGEPQVIDALEFSRDLRLLDPADELGFLALECERQGAAWARDVILATYSALTGDVPPEAVVAFYQSHRACVRARLAAWHLDDDGVRERAQWTARAAHYLYLARRWIDACASGA